MPTTYNGIGTHYYGKRNKESRPGVCENCQRAVDLLSYDTRLWFVVIFIPIIPLKRMRVIDYCPKCSQHRATDLKEWEELKSVQITEGMEKIKSNPTDPEAAIQLHSRLIAFGQRNEADKVADMMSERFSRDAKVQAHLGSTMQYLGRAQESLPYYQRALELDPDLREARIFVGLHMAENGQLEEARQKLRFLEEPGGESEPGVLFALAQAYQKADRHQEALELFSYIGERFPAIAQDKNFRKAVKQSESRIAGWQSQLPPRKHDLKPVFALGGIALLAIAGALIWNSLIAHGRSLHIVSGYDEPVTVQVGGKPPVTLRGRSLHIMKLPEGQYQAVVGGAVSQSVDLRIQSSFWNRWFDDRVFVLNPGGAALIYQEETIYSSRATGNEGGYRLHFGEPFVVLAGIDYPFMPFPDSIEVSSSTSRVRKKRIELADFPVDDGFWALVGEQRYTEAVELGEWHLRLHPDDTTLLPVVAGIAGVSGQSDRIEALVVEAIQRRPVEIEWHRIYQQMNRGPVERAALLAEYDALLQTSPNDSACQYLRGRLCTSRREGMDYFNEALRLNPENVFAHFAIGYNHSSGGDWSAAEKALARAIALQPDDLRFGEAMFEAQLALGRLTELEHTLRDKLTEEPASFRTVDQLMIVLLAQGKTEDVETVAANFKVQLGMIEARSGSPEIPAFQSRVRYLKGDLASMEREPLSEVDGGGRIHRFQILVESGKPQEAAEVMPLDDEEFSDPFVLLAESIAWHAAGRTEESMAWRAKAADLLAERQAEYLFAAEALNREQLIPLSELLDLSLQAHEKAVWLVALAQKFPDQSGELLTHARRLNISRAFPFHLIDRVASSTKTETAESSSNR